MNKKFKIQKELIKCLLSSKDYHALIFSGEGGIGKTLITLETTKKVLNIDEWVYTNGYMTPLSLYMYLYENKDKKFIIIDDTEGIFNNNISLAILKAALWGVENKRECTYLSTTDLKGDTPGTFIIKAKIGILCNEIPKENNISMRALISRAIHQKINLSFNEKTKICNDFIEKTNLIESQKKEVKRVLCKYINIATKDFNFRTLKKLITFVKYDISKAEGLFKATIETDFLIESYIKSLVNKAIKEQVKYFIDFTGKSRATYYRIKKKVVSMSQ